MAVIILKTFEVIIHIYGISVCRVLGNTFKTNDNMNHILWFATYFMFGSHQIPYITILFKFYSTVLMLC